MLNNRGRLKNNPEIIKLVNHVVTRIEKDDVRRYCKTKTEPRVQALLYMEKNFEGVITI